MKMMRRTLLAFLAGLIGTTALQLLDFAKSLDGAAKTVKTNVTSEPNLGDCLRTPKPKDWPAPYLAICQDLTLEIAAPFDNKPNTTKPKAPNTPSLRVSAAIPAPTRAKLIPKPMARLALKETKPAPVKPALIADTCVIDEQGQTTRHINGVSHTYAPAPAEQRPANRPQTGTALLVDATCNVKSPMAGKVAFAGDFKGYRGVVILRLASGQQLIAAGFDRLDVKRGQTIARGALLGATTITPAPALASAFRNVSIQQARHTFLYFEMRNAKGDSQAVNWLPSPTRMSELASK